MSCCVFVWTAGTETCGNDDRVHVPIGSYQPRLHMCLHHDPVVNSALTTTRLLATSLFTPADVVQPTACSGGKQMLGFLLFIIAILPSFL